MDGILSAQSWLHVLNGFSVIILSRVSGWRNIVDMLCVSVGYTVPIPKPLNSTRHST